MPSFSSSSLLRNRSREVSRNFSMFFAGFCISGGSRARAMPKANMPDTVSLTRFAVTGRVLPILMCNFAMVARVIFSAFMLPIAGRTCFRR